MSERPPSPWLQTLLTTYRALPDWGRVLVALAALPATASCVFSVTWLLGVLCFAMIGGLVLLLATADVVMKGM